MTIDFFLLKAETRLAQERPECYFREGENMRQRVTSIRLGLLIAFAAAIAVVAVQAAAGAGATVVRGDQLLLANPSDCPGADEGTYKMAGDLVGCWYTDTFDVVGENPGGGFRASGTEHFVGCLDTNGNGACGAGEPSGRFDTTFTFTAKFAPTGDEIHGRCHHPVVGGTGAFAGASGEISFKDIPNEGRFPYHGPLKF